MATTYSTTLAVRTEAGFYGNPDVEDESIDAIRKQVYNIVRGQVGGRYDVTNMVPGNELFDDSQAAGLLERAEILIAAGYLLNQEYGPEQMGEDHDGDRKIKQGKDLLFWIFDGKMPTRLLDANGAEFTGLAVGTNGEDGIVMTIAEGDAFFRVDQEF